MSSGALMFPAPVSCPNCERPCGEDQLGGCFDCGAKFCHRCDSKCACDALVERVSERMAKKVCKIRWIKAVAVGAIVTISGHYMDKLMMHEGLDLGFNLADNFIIGAIATIVTALM